MDKDLEFGGPQHTDRPELLGGETGESVMMFEETAPSGTETTYHLHHDSDEGGLRA